MQQLEQSLNAGTMRVIIQLRRLLQQDHGVTIDLEDPYLMETLIDAAREARDNKAERLAYELCDQLTELHYRLDGSNCRERLKPQFRSPLHEKFVGANPAKVYRGQRVEGGRTQPVEAPSDEPSEGRRQGRVMTYRGQKVVV